MKGRSNQNFLSLLHKRICSFVANFVKVTNATMKLLSNRFFTVHLVPLLPFRTKKVLNKFLYLCQINFVIFVQKRLVYAQNLTQICWVKFPSPLKKFFTFIPNFLSDKVDRERFFSEFQFTLLKVILKPIVSVVIPVWYYAFLIESSNYLEVIPYPFSSLVHTFLIEAQKNTNRNVIVLIL